MTNKDAPNLTYSVSIPTLEEAEKLHHTIENQHTQLITLRNIRSAEQSASKMCYDTATKVITDLKAECDKLKIALDESQKQTAFWKQEFADASKQSLDTLNMMQNTKHTLETVMEQFFKYENK